MTTTTVQYNDKVVRQFLWASVIFGAVGLLLGVIIALQLAFHPANLSNIAPYFTFGRLRPLHTNAVIFAFVGNMMFAGVYYSTQRLTKARMGHDLLSTIHFWGWQLIIVAAVLTLPFGITQGKEYAELEWPIDIAIALVWVVFAVNFFWTLKNRRERQLYVALWFYIATLITVAILHIVNSLSMPIGLFKSYSIFGGVQDALVQWWYGHNAVAFFLTTPILGIMYYFLPKAADRPVFSYRLSIVHFWSIVFLYIWAGPHHLLNTALPDWAQTIGMIFSVMLWAPSWGGMVNGLLTLRGAWDKVRVDPVLKFFAAGVTFYGMATFEGPLLSIKSVSSLGHYTDWIVGHVHSGALGWNGFMAAGMFYWLVPKLYGTELFSKKMANAHFWMGTLGILFYVISMWVSGITQGLMWRAINEDGGLLYPNFLTTVTEIVSMYWMRLFGGLLYLIGFLLMAFNLVKTAQKGTVQLVSVEVPLPDTQKIKWGSIFNESPIFLWVIVFFLLFATAFSDRVGAIALISVAVVLVLAAWIYNKAYPGQNEWHEKLEKIAPLFTIMAVIAVLIGGLAELIPSAVLWAHDRSATKREPYTPLELEGRDIYIQEGCYNCHSQMIRPFAWETARYGSVSEPEDSVWDHPFQWGSKRTGPDLARVGGRYPNQWHIEHMVDPRKLFPESIMPAYPHLRTERVDVAHTFRKMDALRAMGVKYTKDDIEHARENASAQGQEIIAGLPMQVDPQSKLVALTAYLQRLGKEKSDFDWRTTGSGSVASNGRTP